MSQRYFEKLITEMQAQYKSNPISPIADIETLSGRSIARFIDHTILKPDATQEEILKLCEK